MFAARNMMFAGSSAFDPLSLSPALWLSDTGSDPSVWPDISGNGRNATQATAANQPSIVTNALNGRQVRRFDSANSQTLLLSSGLNMLANVSGTTIFAVVKWNTVPTINTVIINVSIGTSGNLARAALVGGVISQKWGAGGRRLDADSFTFVSSTASATTSATIQSAVFDYANSNLYQYINGSLDGSTTSFQNDGSTSNTNSQAVAIGSSAGTNLFANADMAEILVFPTALSTTDRQRVENYLNAKWAIY